MCQPKKWWYGLLPLALLWLLSNWVSGPKIEANLGQCALAAVKAMPIDRANVDVQGRDIIVTGQTFSADTGPNAARAAAKCNDGARGAIDATALVAEAKPYAWSATRDGARITLGGNVPNPDVRASLNALAKKAFDGAEVVDTMTYARGAPACFAGANALALKALAQLPKGAATLAGDTVSLAGEPRDFAAYDGVQAALKAPLEGCVVKGAGAVLPPEIKPYVWSATRAGNVVTITGYSPSAEVRTTIDAAAKTAIAGAEVKDTTLIARGAPAALVAGAAYGLSQLAKLGDGTVTLTDGAMTIAGEAASPAVFAELAQIGKAAPEGIKLAQMAVRPAEMKPFTWSAARAGDTLTLSGYAPSPGAKERIMAAAGTAIPGAKIIDQMAVARGAPGGIEAVTAFALGELNTLSSGVAGIVDTAFSISGEAPSPQAFAAAMDGLKDLPAGFTLASAGLRAPEVSPFSWKASRDGDTVTLEGYAPSLGARDRIAAAAKAVMPGATVSDLTLVARGAPAGIEAAVAYALGGLSGLASGAAEITDTSIMITGAAATSEAYLAALRAALMPPEGYQLREVEIRAPLAQTPTWSATRDASGVVLRGEAASPEQAAGIADMARAALPGLTVTDKMQIARGVNGDIEAIAHYALGELAKLSEGTVAVTGRDYAIKGDAATVSGYASALDASTKLTAGYGLAGFSVRAPEVHPYVWSATRDGDAVTLSGNVASSGARARLLAAAKAALPGVAITDAMLVARGAPAEFEAMATFGFGQLARLSSGFVTSNESNFSIAGDAATSEAYDEALAAMKNLPAAFGVGAEAIRPPEAKPHSWNAVRGDTQVAMSGSLPSLAAKSAAVAAARDAFPGLAIIDRTGIARGAPANLDAGVAFALGELSKLSAGLASLTDASFSISGEASSAASYKAALDALGALPAPFTLAGAAIRAPLVSPYEWSIKSDGANATIAGFAPSSGAQARIFAAVQKAFPGVKVSDASLVARGAPGGVEAMIDYGLRALPQLSRGGFGFVDGRYFIFGDAPTGAVYEAVIAASQTAPAGFALAKADISLPSLAPYVWRAARDAQTLTLSGYAPTRSAADAIAAVAAKANPGLKIIDAQQLAGGAPAALNALTGYALGELARLDNGATSLNGLDYSITGEAATNDAYAAALAGLAALPAPFRLASEALRGPAQKPFAWFAARSGSGLTLSGSTPSLALQARIASLAKRAFPGVDLVDKTVIARGAPAQFETVVAYGLGELAKLAKGMVTITDGGYAIAGDAPTPVAYEAALEAAKSPGGGFALTAAAIRAPSVQPYVWSASHEGKSLALSGFAPSAEMRAAIAAQAAAAFAGASVDNKILIAEGAPEQLAVVTAYGLGELAKLSRGSVSVTDRVYSITGDAPTSEAYETALAASAKPAGGFTLGEAAITAPAAKPYVWSAQGDAKKLTLAGFAPSLAARAKIATQAAAAFSGAVIDNKMQIAAGAPDLLEVVSAYALGELAKLSRGAVSISDRAYSITGDAPTPEAYETATEAAKKPAGGFVLAQVNISAPGARPYVWAALSEPTKIILSGFAPSPAMRTKFAARAAAAFTDATVENKLLIAAGAPEQLEATAAYALSELAKLSRGAASISDTSYAITGDAPTSAAYEAALEAVKKLPPGFSLAKVDINPPTAKPYVWSGVYDGKSITLTGSAPSADAREKIAAHAQAALPGLAVVNKLQIARGAPAGDFVGAATFGLDSLARLADGRIGLSDLNFSIVGRGKDGIYSETIAEAAKALLPAGFVVAENVISLHEVHPYLFTCARSGEQITLSGNAPSAAARSAVLVAASAIASPGGNVSETLKLAGGLPVGVDYAAATGLCLSELALLKSGAGRISDTGFSISGEALDAKAFQTALAALKAPLPGGLKLETVAITAPSVSPYVFEAVKDAGTLVLTGFYPDEATRDESIDGVKRRFFAEKVVDQSGVASGAPKGFAPAVATALEQLSRLVSGTLTISDTRVQLSGEAQFAKAVEEITNNIKTLLPPGFEGSATITARAALPEAPAVSCQEFLTNLLKLGTIHFDTNSTVIKSESYGLLDALAAEAARCPTARLEIAGHTDSVGPGDYNVELSVRRAQSVIAYLTKSGLPLGSMSPVGYGMSRPVASNDNEDGRAKNRRIDFVVK